MTTQRRLITGRHSGAATQLASAVGAARVLKYPLHEIDVAVAVDAIAQKGAAHALEQRGVVVGAFTNETRWCAWHANKAVIKASKNH